MLDGAFKIAALALEIGIGLSRKEKQLLELQLAGLFFHKLDELLADAFVFVRWVDIEEGKFARVVVFIAMQGDAADGVMVGLENIVIGNVFFDRGARASQQFLLGHRSTGHRKKGCHILFLCRSDLLVFVGIDERANPFVGEDLGQKTLIDAPVDNVGSGNMPATGFCGMQGLGDFPHRRDLAAASGVRRDH